MIAGDNFAREFVNFEVKETWESRGHWLDQPWIDEGQRPALIGASILAVPLAGGEEGPVFPQGTGEFIERLREAAKGEITASGER